MSASTPSSFRPASWRGLTSFDERSSTAALSFNTFDGEVVRLQLALHDLMAVHEVIGELLALRPSFRINSVRVVGLENHDGEAPGRSPQGLGRAALASVAP